MGTCVGLTLGLGAVIVSVLIEGGSLSGFANLPGFLIVFGGTIGAALISFPIQTIKGLPRAIMKSFFPGELNGPELVSFMVEMARRARRGGILSLEEEAQAIKDPFLKKGILLVVDGTDPELVRNVLDIDLAMTEKRHSSNYMALEAMGGYAPTMGIIGTVMGLVNVLAHLEDPSKLGSAIAVAFIATFYGVASANLLWLPLASKLKKRSEDELVLRQMMFTGILSIQAGDSPRVVEDKLKSFLGKVALKPVAAGKGKEQTEQGEEQP